MTKDVNWDAEDASDLSPEEINERIVAEIEASSMSKMEKLRRDNPALQDAWDKIKTIRGITEKEERDLAGQPAWYRAFTEVADGVENSNEAVREAWDQYYTLKMLIVGNERE